MACVILEFFVVTNRSYRYVVEIFTIFLNEKFEKFTKCNQQGGGGCYCYCCFLLKFFRHTLSLWLLVASGVGLLNVGQKSMKKRPIYFLLIFGRGRGELIVAE